jgi:hypothetical protein
MQKSSAICLAFLSSALGAFSASGVATATEFSDVAFLQGTGFRPFDPGSHGLLDSPSASRFLLAQAGYPLQSGQIRRDKKERRSFLSRFAVIAQADSTSQIKILSPLSESTLGQKSTNLVVQYPTGTTVAVTVNGTPLDAAIATQVQPDSGSGTTTQVWYAVPLQSGENTLTVQGGGSPVSVKVTVQEIKARLLFQPVSNPRIAADGRSTVTVEGQITDDKGELIPQDALVTLSATAGKFIGADQDRDRPGFQVIARQGKFNAQLQAGLEPQKVRVRAAVDRLLKSDAVRESLSPFPIGPNSPISEDPIFRNPPPRQNPPYSLLPSLDARTLEAYTQVEFITNLRPPIVSGIINLRIGTAGVNFYDSFRDFLNPDLLDESTRVDVDTAIFATGRIGDWLFTGAFNNQRSLNEDCTGANRLFKADQFCDQVYPTYGDSSTTDFLAPSIDSVYARFERTSPVPGAGTDYLMWGDYRTPEFARASQLYTATNRQLHGLKLNYNLGDLQLTAMYGNNLQGFQRDAITPNGTSGYYYLSRRLVVGGSESIYVESSEIGRPSVVVERRMLLRGPDYEIDYDRGAILFRRPIFATDFDPFGRSLIRRIVATYQYEGIGTGDTSLYAGRLQYNFSREFGRESWAGFSYLREDQGDINFRLYGFDLLVPLGEDARIVAEFARSISDSVFLGDIEGNAYRVELSGTIIPGLIARAYYNSVEEEFTNNATLSFTPGETRYGAELAARVTPTTQFNFQYEHQRNFGIAPAARGITSIIQTGFGDLFNPTAEPIPGTRLDNRLTTIRAGVTQKIGMAELGFDFVNRNREDRTVPGLLDEGGNQFVSRFSIPILDNLTFRAQDERNLGDGDPLYPNRTTLALDWAAYPGVTMRLAQQFIDGGQFGDRSITSLETITDYRISEDTSITGRYGILNGVNGWSGMSALGLNHRIKLAPGLRLSLGLERISGDIFLSSQAGQQFAQPVAVGQSAAALGINEGTSYTVGLEYTDNPNFKASARFEYRDSDDGDNMVISAAAAGKLSPALTAVARYQQANFANQLLADSGFGDTANLKFGLAYRNPSDDKFNALLRYEYRQNPGTIPDSLLFGSGTGSRVHLVALEAIYAPNWRWEFYGKMGVRNTTSYLAQDLSGTNTITLGQFRAVYRLGYRMDIAGEVRYIGQSNVGGYGELGYVAEVGYYLTPELRVGLGYNFGRADRDFGDRSRGGLFFGVTYRVNDIFGFGVQRPSPAPPPKPEPEKPVAVQPVSGGEAK